MLSVLHYNGVYGGPQNRNARLTPLLRERGVETVMLMPDERGPAADILRGRGVDVVQQPLHRVRATLNPLTHVVFLSRFVSQVWRIRRLIKKRQIDVVLVNGSINPHGAVAARWAGVPVIWQLLDTRPPSWMLKGVMLWVRLLADVVMTTGLAVARLHPGALAFGDRLVSFFPPVDTQRFKPDAERRRRARQRLGVPDDGVLVGSIGNLTAQKGHEFLIDALGRVLPADERVHGCIVGCVVETHRDYASGLDARAERVGLVSTGRFAMVTPDISIADYLAAFDVFVLASVPRSEGIPTSVLEAMSCGVPVVAANVGAVSEAVSDGETGVLYESTNVEALANGIKALVEDAPRRRAMSHAARSHAEAEFDMNQCADVHRRAIDLALGA